MKEYYKYKNKQRDKIRTPKNPKAYRPNVYVLKEVDGVPRVLQVSGRFYTLMHEHHVPRNAVKRGRRRAD